MKKPGNFSKAIEELLSGNAAEGEKGSEGEMAAGNSAVPFGDERASQGDVRFPSKTETVSRVVPCREAVITEDMVIKGSISSAANILIEGTILGDVASEGDIVVRGKVEGNIKVHAATIKGGSILGDVECTGTILIGEESTVTGNIKGGHIDVNGKVSGNLLSGEKVTLNPRAVIEGDISALGLSMFEGAELKGNVNVRKVQS